MDNEISFTSEKECSFGIHYNMDEPQNHYGMWKKTHRKDYILYDSISIKYQEGANL